jgi:hypothetical protein
LSAAALSEQQKQPDPAEQGISNVSEKQRQSNDDQRTYRGQHWGVD